MLHDRLEPLLKYHPFTRLNELLKGLQPGKSPIVFSVGEPQQAIPPFLAEVLQRNASLWSRYALANGTPDFRAAVADWLVHRFRLPAGMLDPDRHILPAPGSREALFMVALSAVGESATRRRPAVLIPNPFYHVYAGAAAVAGGEPVFLPATKANGFLPPIDDVPAEVLARTALVYVNSPANPHGAVAPLAYLERWVELARHHGFVVAFDECYSEIYDDVPPAGGLEACAALGGDLTNVMVFHSLSKRSGVPGLRSGFVAGDPRLIGRQTQLVNYGGVAVPLPVLAASSALWRDEEHVEMGRQRYRANFAIAERLLAGRLDFTRPSGGFFLWPDVGDGETAARRLWMEAGVRVLPGAYMGQADPRGENPGRPYVRIALVHNAETVEDGLRRLCETLAGQPTPSDGSKPRILAEAYPS